MCHHRTDTLRDRVHLIIKNSDGESESKVGYCLPRKVLSHHVVEDKKITSIKPRLFAQTVELKSKKFNYRHGRV